ncbi:hypothetical protein D3C85_1609210 [compost metagenome]
MDQSRFFSADKCSGTKPHINIKAKAGSQDIITDQTIFAGLGKRFHKPLDSDWIFRTDIDKALV